MRIFVLGEHDLTEAAPEELSALLEAGTQIWVEILRPNAEEVRVLRDVFRFHPLAIEDSINMRQRPKVEDYGSTLFTIMNPLHFDDGELTFSELDAFLGPNFIVTVHSGVETLIEQVISTCRKRISYGDKLYVGLILYLLVDVTVDGYFPALDTISDELDSLTDQLILDPDPLKLARIFALRKILLEFMRVVGQQRDMFTVVLRDHQPFVTDMALRYYMRDVFDHLLRLNDLITQSREEAASAVELFFSSQSNKLNTFIQKLTIITVGIGVLTVIGGFYGMNFLRTFPAFESSWGVLFVLGLMAVVVLGTLYALRRVSSQES